MQLQKLHIRAKSSVAGTVITRNTTAGGQWERAATNAYLKAQLILRQKGKKRNEREI